MATVSCSKQLWYQKIATPLGEMEAAADENELYFLHFVDTPDHYVEQLLATANIISKTEDARGQSSDSSTNSVLQRVEAQLAAYFAGKRKVFDIPLHLSVHKTFRQNAWHALQQISFGETISYKQQAELMQLTANFVRAIAGANSKNPFPLILPCHRVIAANGDLSGYHGGVWRKKALINHEKQVLTASQMRSD